MDRSLQHHRCWRLLCAGWLILLWAVPAWAIAPEADGTQSPTDPSSTSAGSVVYRQFDPDADVVEAYARVSEVSFAMASVPDPRVPRHRRMYDLSVSAIMQGMQDQGYSLDRYSFPWQSVLSGDGASTVQATDDCSFGIMLFRRDPWRKDLRQAGVPAAPSLRALYVVPETATYGIPLASAHAAARRILAQTLSSVSLPAPCPAPEEQETAESTSGNGVINEVSTPPRMMGRLSIHDLCGASPHLLFSGPHFSGSLESLLQLNALVVKDGAPPLCAISPSATASSNRHADGGSRGLRFRSMAVDDDTKLAALWTLAERIGTRRTASGIAILHDTTLFGGEVCPTLASLGSASTPICDPAPKDAATARLCLCARSHQISYPSNIADIRAALQPDTEGDTSLTRKVALGKYLPLDHGAGNGSEFPDGRQSKLTAAGGYLQLQRTMNVLKNLDPQLVIVVGTDVRDRMFLFEQLREALPSAQLADLEADTLSAHPQYIHATRGAVLMASERITWFTAAPAGGINMAVGATDTQVLQRALVRGIDVGGPESKRTPLPKCASSLDRPPVMHVVGRKAVLPVICPGKKERYLRLYAAPALALASFGLLLLTAPIARAVRVGERPSVWWTTGYRHLRNAVGGYDPAFNPRTVWALLALAAMLAMAAVLGNRVLAAIAVVVGPAYCWAIAYLAGAFDTLGGPGPRHARPAYLRAMAGHGLAAVALLLAATAVALWIGADAFGQAVMVRLGFAAGYGMALCIAVMLAVLLLLLADSALTVARGASRRNAGVVVQALGLGDDSDERLRLRRMFQCSLFPLSPLMAVGAIALVLCVLYAVPVKLTLFGKAASVLALVCMIAMSYVSLLFLVTAIRMRQRAHRIAALLRDTVRAAEAVEEGDSEAVGLWPPASTAGVRFASTPAVARVQDGGRQAVHLLTPAGRPDFARALAPLTTPTAGSAASALPRDARLALYVLLASEVSLVRWATFCGVASCLAVTGFVYLFPVSGADAFILFNLAVLVLTGAFAGHTAMSFERNDVMSNLLCNRSAKMEWSGTLFNYIAVPFLVLAIVIAITQIPGVINLGGGMFDSTLNQLARTVFGGL
ncbi:hypothetical protein [Pseudoxanthomonas sp. PXM02]|uniref:hypothetical protein n=1 Tax=Pseudoxanthomonas sp. PXM02 TaxID=2769294 RepID=UPI0017820E4C|nr:hypothetical protein [Pseudoxanthomonas sp. PXM02]MBD9478812.1 hypothetical protein [Pseudoxanthomonas sp. PXM02]